MIPGVGSFKTMTKPYHDTVLSFLVERVGKISRDTTTGKYTHITHTHTHTHTLTLSHTHTHTDSLTR